MYVPGTEPATTFATSNETGLVSTSTGSPADDTLGVGVGLEVPDGASIGDGDGDSFGDSFGSGVTDTDGVDVGLGLGEGVGLVLGEGVAVGVGVGVGVGQSDSSGEPDGVGVGEVEGVTEAVGKGGGAAVAEGVGDADASTTGLAPAEIEGVGDPAVTPGDGVGDGSAVDEGLWVGVGVGVGHGTGSGSSTRRKPGANLNLAAVFHSLVCGKRGLSQILVPRRIPIRSCAAVAARHSGLAAFTTSSGDSGAFNCGDSPPTSFDGSIRTPADCTGRSIGFNPATFGMTASAEMSNDLADALAVAVNNDPNTAVAVTHTTACARNDRLAGSRLH